MPCLLQKGWIFSFVRRALLRIEIVELAATLIEMEGCDVIQGDFKSGTPPILAAASGQEGY